MTSSYSTDLKLELMVTGENAGTWGDNTNNNLNLIQQAIAGYEAIALSDGGTVALAMTDKTISNARNMVIKFTGTLTGASSVTIPDSIEKFYIFDCSAVVGPTNLTIKTASGSGFTLDQAKIYAAYSDGTNLNEISLDTLGGTVAAAQIADSAVTTAKIADDAVTSAKIADDAVVAAGIADGAVGTAAIADDAVTAAKLADTSVSAGSYDLATITVDAQGRLTAASAGSAGGGGYVPRLVAEGPASGTYTTPANASTFYAYAVAGGGGGGGGPQGGGAQRTGGSGGNGGFGLFTGNVTASTGYAYSVGAGGNGGTTGFHNNNGGAGGATNVTNLLTTNGGGGGNESNGPANGNTGTAGTAPGAAFSIGFSTFLFSRPSTGTGGTNPSTPGAIGPNGNSGGAGKLTLFDDGGI